MSQSLYARNELRMGTVERSGGTAVFVSWQNEGYVSETRTEDDLNETDCMDIGM